MAPWPAPGGTAAPGDARAPAAVAFQSVTTSARAGAAIASTPSTAIQPSRTRRARVARVTTGVVSVPAPAAQCVRPISWLLPVVELVQTHRSTTRVVVGVAGESACICAPGRSDSNRAPTRRNRPNGVSARASLASPDQRRHSTLAAGSPPKEHRGQPPAALTSGSAHTLQSPGVRFVGRIAVSKPETRPEIRPSAWGDPIAGRATPAPPMVTSTRRARAVRRSPRGSRYGVGRATDRHACSWSRHVPFSESLWFGLSPMRSESAAELSA